MTAVRAYRLLLSPWLGGSCRFVPTCSAYALDALALHGAVAGGWLTVRRIARCQPFCAGGCDPVPAQGRPRPAAVCTAVPMSPMSPTPTASTPLIATTE